MYLRSDPQSQKRKGKPKTPETTSYIQTHKVFKLLCRPSSRFGLVDFRFQDFRAFETSSLGEDFRAFETSSLGERWSHGPRMRPQVSKSTCPQSVACPCCFCVHALKAGIEDARARFNRNGGRHERFFEDVVASDPQDHTIHCIHRRNPCSILRRYEMFINASRTTVQNSTHSATKERLIPVRCQDE